MLSYPVLILPEQPGYTSMLKQAGADEELDIKTPHGIKTRRFGPPQQACILSMSRGDEEEAMQTDTAREVVILSTSQFSRAYKE